MPIVNGWISGLRHVSSPNFNARPAGAVVDMLVLHNISLPPGQFGGGHVEALFCNTLDCGAHAYFAALRDLKVSAHFFIDRTGGVTQFVDTEQRAWHAGQSCWQGRENCNDFSIGIELEGTDVLPYEDVQYEALCKLTRDIMQRYAAITPNRIVGHSDIAPGRKTDPGASFDWQRFRLMLAGVGSAG